ncbi:5-carboxymethyl-2-hydroxymuconate Delta-isomerase [Legionella beliardensis]|uniref:5-carboxymethyl-2-hydroxymuconate Delta-isomerase n=1 Tax=Legionella beliardensis TaxID=91822 RepID=A0A378I3E4_9GAMM|nr:hypothetical protein [Legionella beliardensis]STX29688.1 5-carboxymethyl-2-hydroxymuconate Delta-isomerase [Legionella beliardensis]
MPHLILECSDNIDIKAAVMPFFAQAHSLLERLLPTQLSSCKSRFICHNMFYLGSGQVNNAFVHLTLKILAGRSDATKEYVGRELLSLMKKLFQQDNRALNLEFSIEIIETSSPYFKG